ncbi:sensor histidine kinase [Rariglobus hedericola]|uniref:sensor histidine kinase n=1 Tax=Rariglobus hedericola TaxID=2597822 RepID=UPI001EEFCC83|nr:sensor histidine kinase [Rariglobus hedericola]
MNFPQLSSRLGLFAGLVCVMAGLGWLVFGVAGHRDGMEILPNKAGSTVEWMNDPGARLSFEEVVATSPAEWRAWDGLDYLRAVQGDAVWVRATVRNPGGRALQGVLADTEYFPDQIDFWIQDDAGAWQPMRSGEAADSKVKPLWGRTAAFTLTVPAGGERVAYLRAEDYFNVYLRPRWWPEVGEFFAEQVRDTLAEAICYGGVLALLLYNGVLWARLRFPDTGWYVLYAGTMAGFNFISNGGAALLGFAVGSPWKEMLVTGLLSASGLFLVQFARVFLGTAARVPGTDRVLRGLRWLLAVLLAGVAMMPWMSGLHWLGAVVIAVSATHLVLLAVAVAGWRAGVSHARFFVAAFGLLLAGAAPAVVTWLNQDILSWAAMCLLAGSTLEMLVLSFAVADRFARIQRERAEAQTKLIDETEQRRAIQEAYADELEVEVRERTRELVEANADKDRMIAVIGHDLRSPLTALTRTAEHLGAGETGQTPQGRFIGDAAQLGRQVLLLIEDLVLWARLRAGSKFLVAQPVTGLVSPVLALYRSQADLAGLELRMVDVPDGLKATTDLVLAQTLIRNLVANALRYARSRVHVTATGVPDGVRITVRDDGPGLPPVVAARLASDADVPDWAGNGLGLRLCLEIARALDAGLSAKPVEGGGTEFSFTLLAAPDKLK